MVIGKKLFEILINIDKHRIWELDLISLKCLSRNFHNQFWTEVILAWNEYKTNFEHEIDVRTYPL